MAASLTRLPRAATHSSLDLFERAQVLVNFDNAQPVSVFPITGLDGPTLEFEVRSDRNAYLDLSEVCLELVVQVKDIAKDTRVVNDAKFLLANNTLHSLFSDCDVSINGEHISSSNGLYAHKSYITTEWSHTMGCKETLLECQGYKPKGDLTDAKNVLKGKPDLSKPIHLIGKIAAELFSSDKLLIPKLVMRIKLLKNSNNFIFYHPVTNDTALDAATGLPQGFLPNNYAMQITKACLWTRQMVVTESVNTAIEKSLLKCDAGYMMTESEAKTFIIPAGQSSFIRENVFNNKPIRSLAIAMNTNEDFIGSVTSNPFCYRDFGLQKLVIYRNGSPIVNISLANGGYARMYYVTNKSLHFDHNSPGITLSDYRNGHFVMIFDLTSTLQSNIQCYYPELVGAALRLELSFKAALEKSIEVLLIGEQLTTLYVKPTGEVYKDG